MKKEIAKTIKTYAEKLPIIYEWEMGSEIMTGEEMNLSPYGDKRRYDKDRTYVVPVPQLRAVTHEQQMKDAHKAQGWQGVVDYVDRVLKREVDYTYQNVINQLSCSQ